jgi:hypothetical protein
VGGRPPEDFSEQRHQVGGDPNNPVVVQVIETVVDAERSEPASGNGGGPVPDAAPPVIEEGLG